MKNIAVSLCLLFLLSEEALAQKKLKKLPESAKVAIIELRKMVSSVELNLSYKEFREQLVTLKPKVDNALAELPESKIKDHIQIALHSYILAQDFWYSTIRNSETTTQKTDGFQLVEGQLNKARIYVLLADSLAKARKFD